MIGSPLGDISLRYSAISRQLPHGDEPQPVGIRWIGVEPAWQAGTVVVEHCGFLGEPRGVNAFGPRLPQNPLALPRPSTGPPLTGGNEQADAAGGIAVGRARPTS